MTDKALCKYRRHTIGYDNNGNIVYHACMLVHIKGARIKEEDLCKYRFMEVIFCKRREVD